MAYIAKRGWMRTADDRVVPWEHPDAAFVLVCEGGTIPDADAIRYGLPALDGVEDVKARQAPPENKARMFAPADKRGR